MDQFDQVSETAELHNGLSLDSEGKLSGEHNVLVTTLEGNGYVGAGVGWDSNGGRSASASGGYGFKGGSTVDAEASWDGKDYRGSVNNGLVVSDHATLSTGLTYDGATKSLGINSGINYANPENKVTAGVGVGYASNDFVESGSLSESISPMCRQSSTIDSVSSPRKTCLSVKRPGKKRNGIPVAQQVSRANQRKQICRIWRST